MRAPIQGAAEVLFGDGEFHVRRQGNYVLCAVTGNPIPLHELRYWNVARQEAYSTPQVALTRHREMAG